MPQSHLDCCLSKLCSRFRPSAYGNPTLPASLLSCELRPYAFAFGVNSFSCQFKSCSVIIVRFWWLAVRILLLTMVRASFPASCTAIGLCVVCLVVELMARLSRAGRILVLLAVFAICLRVVQTILLVFGARRLCLLRNCRRFRIIQLSPRAPCGTS